MAQARIELWAREARDRETLEPIARALRELGEAADVVDAPGAADLRVVAERGSGSGAPAAAAQVVVLDELELPAAARCADWVRAELVLVPGSQLAEALRQQVGVPVEIAGLARLDAALARPAQTRSEARAALAIPQSADVVLLQPAAGAASEAEVMALAAEGPLVVLLPAGVAGPWLETQRARAARTPGLALLEDVSSALALAAADVVCAPTGALLREAQALSRRAVLLEGGAAGRVRAALAHSGQPMDAASSSGWLAHAGSAARRSAELIRDHARARHSARAARVPASDSWAEIDALLAFGDVEAARGRLCERIAREPSTEAQRRLAALERGQGRIDAARAAADAGERLARLELARVICERARICLDSGQGDAARAQFDEASRVCTELADPLVGLGSLALGTGDALAGEQWFRRALEREKSARTLAGLGLAHAAQGRPRDAIAVFEQALDLEPDCLPAVAGMVEAAWRTGELDVAERRVAAYVDLHGANLDMAFTLAGLRADLGRIDGALEMLERVELFDPDYEGLAELRRKLRA
jgi:tetratricopeptide (TPR) repeat protein